MSMWKIRISVLTVLVAGFFVLINMVNQYHVQKTEEIKKIDAEFQGTFTPQPDKDFYQKLHEKNNFIRTLIVGDSIGEGAGVHNGADNWITLISKSLTKEYGIVSYVSNMSQGGGTVLGGWRDYNLFKNKTYARFDLVFICFGQNDQGLLPLKDYTAIYERLIRQVKEEKQNPEIFLIIENAMSIDEYPVEVRKLAQNYNLSVIDTRAAFEKLKLSKIKLSDDTVHPNDKGQLLYQEVIMKAIKDNLESGKKITYNEKTPLINQDAQRYNAFKYTNEYSAIKGFNSKAGISTGVMENDFLEAKVKGSTIGISIKELPNGGNFNIYVDDKLIKEIGTYTPFERRNTFIIGDSFSENDHLVKVVINGKKDPSSDGTVVSILGFVSNGK